MSFDDPESYPQPAVPEKYLVCPHCDREGPHHGSDHDLADPKLVLTCGECSHVWSPHELWFDAWERDQERRESEPRKKQR